MKAKRLLLLTDVAGVLDKDKNLIPELTVAEARELIRNGTITGGMIPKIEGCIEVVEAGVEAVVIIDGRVPHCVLLELFTEHGVGTLVGGTKKREEGRMSGASQVRDRAVASRQRQARHRARLRCHPRLDLRSRQHALSGRVQPVRPGRPAMGEFIASFLGVPFDYARHLQKSYYRQFGTTLAGLMMVHKMRPEAFLDYVHDIDLAVGHRPRRACRPPSSSCRAASSSSPTASRAHAERVAGKLGILHLFEDIYRHRGRPTTSRSRRPGPYKRLLARHGVSTARPPPCSRTCRTISTRRTQLGMTTVLVHSSYVDHPVQLRSATGRAARARPSHDRRSGGLSR